MKSILPLFIMLSVLADCNSQKPKADTAKKFEFTQLTFHSTRCNGTCPEISMNIYGDSTIELIRSIYTSKGVADTVRSGGFKGKMLSNDYGRLMVLLKEIDWEKIHFPAVNCCDAPVRTIILSYNDLYKQFKSMTPPPETQKLFEFLTNLGVRIELPRYRKPIDFEDVSN